ncbi:3D-(3,5/4)-trihydroxycyclohexane-1,2-dione acylhydrolase (decyclizing) [Nocardioides cynanchi]|uniref:3D-(3,5/4)-trihydroxycyclohexane-1,2-dione acylhydrolase (decyclizing) n=1 Tax=Nocardioides cynanchi TaxID=2558918 RepID=UPI001247A7EA|nr:3D-(3,5/4)-trihydroxycyclohexane-1,2-dione acylhydrolase (decyclizing) [Nocardioides cynanchi]
MSVRLTVAQAIVRFLEVQYVERDGVETPFFAGCWGIFGHGNVAGVGQALLERESAENAGSAEHVLRYHQARNEQAMVHAAVGYARHRDRLSAFVCTASVGPGSTNMVTGAALATVNRIPVLLLPGDVFATRAANPVLQEIEDPRSYDVSVNDCFKPVSRYWDRVNRPEQLPSALLAAVRVLTDPAETGAVTLALPQDVQAQAWDWEDDLFARRVWHVSRQVVADDALARAAAVVRSARRPLLVAGGGVIYSDAGDALRAFVEATGIPVAETQAGKGSLRFDHPLEVGAVGATGTTAADALAAEADVVIGVGTRYSDFTTGSRTVFADPGVRFVNLNVTGFDAYKLSGEALVGDARRGLEQLGDALTGWRAPAEHSERAGRLAREWDDVVQASYDLQHEPLPAQSEVLGVVNRLTRDQDVVVCAAGSMPGDLHKLWRTRDRKGYHVEYGFSCMGYEIAGGLGVKLAVLDAGEDREVVVMVGDGSYLMMSQEIVTAVQEGVKLIVVLVQNHGFASIGALSESLGSQRFGTSYRYRTPTGLDGDHLPVDLAANAASLGARVISVADIAELEKAFADAQAAEVTTVIHVETDPLVPAPDSPAWWDVPVSEVADLASTREARTTYDVQKARQRSHLRPIPTPGDPP